MYLTASGVILAVLGCPGRVVAGHVLCGERIMDIMETIKEQISNNRVLLYMKGSPNQPQCGFSARAVQALASVGERFAYVDILSNPEIRSNLPIYANWPTFPQLWVDGELIGGCDIIAEMETSGELAEIIKSGGSSDSD